MFDYVLTCLPLYSLKGLYKGTYTLPKQHKRRSGIRFTVVSFLFNDMWHCYVGSICGDTLQQFSHLWTCWSLFVHNMSAIVSPSCMRSGECVSRHRFVCAHSGCVLSPPLPLNEESFCTLIKTQITLHFMNTISIYKKSNLNWFAGWQAHFYSSVFCKYFLWLSALLQIFVEILSIKTSFLCYCVIGNE